MNFGTDEDELAIKKYIISLLVKQALTDGKFSLVEKKYLNHAGESFALSDNEIAAIRLNPESYNISPPPNELVRIKILYHLLFMMRADQNISIVEEQLCYKIGLRLGFREDMVTDLIQVMKKYLNQKLPPDAMIEKVKVFLN